MTKQLGQKPSAIWAPTSTKAVSLHHCAGDAEVFEGCHTQRATEVTGRPDELGGSDYGDSGFTWWQHHHHCLDVWDGETRVLSETPDANNTRDKEEVTG